MIHTPFALLRGWISQHRLPAFVLVAFGWSWTWDGVYYALGWWQSLPTTFPRQWGVPLGALVVIWASDTSVRAWLGRLFQWRLRAVLYLIALLVPLGITNLQPVIRALGGGSVRYAPPGPLPLILLFIVANALLLGGIEELGWRGFLQPRVQQHTSVLTAGVLIGVLWWAWHLPLFVGHPNFSLDPLFVGQYTVFVIGASTVFGAFVNVTDGSVLPLMLMHASVNVGALLEGSGGVLADSEVLPLVVGSGAWWLIVLALVVLSGREMVSGAKITPVSELFSSSSGFESPWGRE